MQHYEVAIIGFGPTGATLANLLGICNLSTLLIDQQEESCRLPRAVHFDDEVMRVFQTIGIADELVEYLHINPGMRFINRSTNRLLLDWSRPQKISVNGWNSSYRFHQPDLENLLHKNLKKFTRVKISGHCEVLKLIERSDQIELKYFNRKKNQEETVSASYVVGCDGAHSFTRKRLTKDKTHTVHDFGYNERWLVVDLILRQPQPQLTDFTIQYCHPEFPITSARGPGLRRRWEFALKDEPKSHFSEEDIWQKLHPWIKKDQATLERHAVYTFHSTLALKWHRHQIFIAGDAAHQTPPFMGQGMCAGIRDAMNLAWKIAWAIKHRSSSRSKNRLLHSYPLERIEHVKKYILTAIKLGEIINGQDEKNIFETLNSPQRKMESIAPKLGEGLSIQKNDLVGTLFPQPILSDRLRLDDHVGYSFALILTPSLAKKLSVTTTRSLNRWRGKQLSVLETNTHPNLERFLKDVHQQAILVRPDRYILATACDLLEFDQLWSYSDYFRSAENG